MGKAVGCGDGSVGSKENWVDQDGGLEMVRVFLLLFTGELSAIIDELTAVPILQRLQQQTTRKSGFAPAGFPDQHDILRLGDELQLRKPANLFAVHARLATSWESCCSLVSVTGITGVTLNGGQQYFMMLGPLSLSDTRRPFSSVPSSGKPSVACR